ncbi:MupA/Atu3671 family FMN-dependent luciferase-like monooxygenase [Kitasatospora sp. NPDC004531]
MIAPQPPDALAAATAAADSDLAEMAELSRRIAEQLAGTAPAAPSGTAPAMHGPRVAVDRGSGMVSGTGPDSRKRHLDDLVRRYTAKTATSKELAQRHRRVLADSRAVVGFRSSTKEMLYPIAARGASGVSITDIDGNRYTDITMGFGVLMFGHEPPFVREAVREHLSRGVQLGPRNAETGEAAELLAEITGMERVAFANSGTEANSAAIRLARAATGRRKIVTFHGSYHGHADNVLGRAAHKGEGRATAPVSIGIPDSAVADLLVLDYGDPASLRVIEEQAQSIAACIVEPVQSRHPSLQPVEFVRELRELTRRHGIVLMFDEMLTGFRPALRGAQELYGVTPDLATYGKLLGGGFPIGAIAGRADIMDGVDGGHWNYGDASYPPGETTFFGGTYIQHPVSMVAARAVLTHLKNEGPALQQRLNARTDRLAADLNGFFEAEEFPLRLAHFGSMFRFEHRADMELLYHHLLLRGVFVWEWRNFFLSTAHTDDDLATVTAAVRDSLHDLRNAGFFPTTRTPAPTGTAPRATPTPAVQTHAGPQAPAPVGPESCNVPTPALAAVPAVAAAEPTQVASPVARPATAVAGTTTTAPTSPSAPTPILGTATSVASTPVATPDAAPAAAVAAGPQATATLGAASLADPTPNAAAAPTAAPTPVPPAATPAGPQAPAPVGAMPLSAPVAGTSTVPQALARVGAMSLCGPAAADAGAATADAPVAGAPAAPQSPVPVGARPHTAPSPSSPSPSASPSPATAPAPSAAPPRAAGAAGVDFGIYFFGDYPQEDAPRLDKYATILETARFADTHGFHSLWMPERHFHSFGGLFPNPAVLGAALARETERVRINAGSVVLPLHDPIRVAEEWSMVDNLSGGRVGIGCASGWNANDFVFFPERFGRHRESMFEQLADVRALWRGEALKRTVGDGGETAISLFPRPVQEMPPMFTAVVGNPASYELAARHDLGIVTNLMSQSIDQLRDNIARYRRARAAHGLDPAAGRVAILLHTLLGSDHDQARDAAFEPLSRYMRASLSLFGSVTNSLGYQVDLSSLSQDDQDVLFARAYRRYCDDRALIGTADSVAPVVDAVTAAGVDEIVALVDFGVPEATLRAGLPHLDALRRSRTRPAAPSAPAAAREPQQHPLSCGQQRIWMQERIMPGGTAYNESKALLLDGPLDVPALRSAVRSLVARHESLRTVFREDGAGEPVQLVLEPHEPDFEVIDRSARTPAGADPHAAVQDVLDAESARCFDLAAGPLFVTRLVKLAEQRHVLVLSLHHIVVDAESASVMTRDLSAFYRAATAGRTVPDGELPALTGSYADHARAQRAAAANPRTAEDLAFWRETLGGELPVLDLPTDRPRPPVMTSRGKAAFRTLAPELSDGLRALSRSRRATLFMTLVAGYAALLHRLTGDQDVVIGTPISDRPEGSEHLVGFFVNTLALRVDLSGDPDFGTLLDRVRRTALDAYDHAEVPFESVVRELAPSRATDRTPVFQVLAEFERDEPFRLDLPGVRATALDAGPDKALADLCVYFTDGGPAEGIRCHLEYNTDLFDQATVDGWFTAFADILRQAVADDATPLSRLTAAPAASTAREASTAPAAGTAPAADGWLRGPAREVPGTTVHAWVARQAARHPGRPAVVDGETVLTYGELERRATRLAATIRHRLGPPQADRHRPVPLWLDRSPELIVAMLAVLKAGHGYAPIDPGLGLARADAVLADCASPLLLTTGDAAAALDLPAGTTVLDVTAADDPGSAPAPAEAADPATPDALCYALHTSGTTGRPKGVAVPHRNLVAFCQWHHRHFETTTEDRTALLSSVAFDGSLMEIWPTLTAGATLVVADDETRKDPLALARWYTVHGITFSFLTTAFGEALIGLDERRQPPLRHLAVGGDVLRARPHASAAYRVTNVYGPTETTILCTVETVAPKGAETGPIPIGLPIDNVRVRLLDADGRPVPDGAVGEVYVAGAGVALGYLDRPDETAARFLPGPDGLTYRTGDLARRNPTSGALEFCGRADDQVKIRGFRVEPGEATEQLRRVWGVRDAAVVARRDARGDAFLVGYVVPAEPLDGDDPAAAAQRSAFAVLTAGALGRRVPEYLVPRAWSVLPALPLNGIGKLDRSALPEPDLTALPTPAPSAAPAPRPSRTLDRVRELWAAEFGTDPEAIDPQASFFALGGHSIIAIRLVNRVREALGVDVPVARLFQQPTPAAMAAFVDDSGPAALSAPAAVAADRPPLTVIQARFVDRIGKLPVPEVFNVALRLLLTGPLDVAALHTALTGLTERHESLRTRCVRGERIEDWWQEVLPATPVRPPVEDLRGLTETERDAELSRISTEAARHPFDIEAGARPAIRLVRTGEQNWALVFVMHHSMCDGWAVSLLLKDLAALYRAALTGQPHGLPPATQQIAYARAEQARNAADREDDYAYWERQLKDAPPFTHDLPLDRPRPEQLSGLGQVAQFTVPSDTRRRVEELAKRLDTTPFAVTVTALGHFMRALNGRTDHLVQVAYANRTRPEEENLLACTASSLLLRLRTDPATPFADQVRETARTAHEALAHLMPLSQIGPRLRERGHHHIPDRLAHGFQYQNSLETDIDLPHLTTQVEDLTVPAARGEFNLGLVPAGDTYAGYLEYTTDLWTPETITTWTTHYTTLLHTLTTE